MNKEETPFGIILISTYFILIGVYFLSINSFFAKYNYINNIVLIGLSIIGVIFIFLGWGILLQKKWAYYCTIIMSILSIFLIFLTSGLFILFGIAFTSINLILQVIILIYMFSKPELFGLEPQILAVNTNRQSVMNYRYCLKCGRGVPVDSKFCPYCTKKIED
jgi:hypothetical protein